MYSRPQQENDQSRHLNDKGQDVGKEEPLLILGTFLETGCFGTDQNYNSYTLVGRDGAGERGRSRLGKKERGLLKTSQCITQNVRVYSFILGIAGTENPAQKCHRLSCLITCCLLTPSLQGACLNLPLGPQGTPETENIPGSFSGLLVLPWGLEGEGLPGAPK